MVDENTKIIRGAVAAEVGAFRTPGRGQFDLEALQSLAKLINAEPDGIVINFGHHQDVGTAAALDAFLGRAKNARVDRKRLLVDLHFNPVAFMSLDGGVSRGERILSRAKSDPRSFALSFVLRADKLPQRGASPIWRPLEVSSVDFVMLGDAAPSGLLPPALSVPPAYNVVLSRETHLAEALAFIPRS